ncbi:hypothetical protein C8Q80DRAFT_894366 [Daedaleopsis nitida]|nr:hypothetical protein C8Q80DRAFT_894366 [Daedaleopsis nitida]
MAVAAPRVPVEVAEKVIDHLTDDYSSLRNCALTCQSWLPRSRARLYYTVRVGDPLKLDLLRRVLMSSSILSSLVYAARVDLGCSNVSYDTAPLILLPLLPNLQTWTFNVDRDSFNQHRMNSPNADFKPITLKCLGCYSTVKELELIQVKFEDVAQLAKLLLALPALSSLRIHKTEIRHAEGGYLDRLLNRLSEQMQLTTLQMSDIVHLADNSHFGTPSTLFKRLQGVVAPHLKTVAVSVQELVVLIPAASFGNVPRAQLESALLRECYNLSELRVTVNSDHGMAATVYSPVDVFRQITEDGLPPKLSRLQFDLSNTWEAERFIRLGDRAILQGWHGLDHSICVAKSTHPSLQHIEFIIPTLREKIARDWISALRTLLPESIAYSCAHLLFHPDQTQFCSTDKHDYGPLTLLCSNSNSNWVASYGAGVLKLSDPRSVNPWQHDSSVSVTPPPTGVKVQYLAPVPTIVRFGDRPTLCLAVNIEPRGGHFLIILRTYYDHHMQPYPKVTQERPDIRSPSNSVITHVLLQSLGPPHKIVFMSGDGVMVQVTKSVDRASETCTLGFPPRAHPVPSQLRPGSFAVSEEQDFIADWHTPGMVLLWKLTHQLRDGFTEVSAPPHLLWRYTIPSLSSTTGTHLEQYVLTAQFISAPSQIDGGQGFKLRSVLSCVSNRGMLWYMDISSGRPLRRPIRLPHSAHLFINDSYIAYSSDGHFLAWTAPLSDRHHEGSSGSVDARSQSLRCHSTVRVLRPTVGNTEGLYDPLYSWHPPHAFLLQGHEAQINALAFSPGGEQIATASADRTVRLWSTRDGQCLEIFCEHTAAVTHVSTSKRDEESYRLVSGSEDGRVWIRVIENHPLTLHRPGNGLGEPSRAQ